MRDLRTQLQEIFGLDDFRPAQREVIEDVLHGRDVLCVMPTGAGKSLCYQLPAVVRGGLTIVVSPLISLMEDQVQQLRDEEISAALLNSSLTPAQQRTAIAQIEEGFQGLLYVAPERFFAPNFQPLLSKLKPTLLAIDEAHCISQWGHDFRPEYSRLGDVRHLLGSPATIALTATATEEVRGDIIRQLGLRDPRIVVTGFDRPNLIYQSQRISKVRQKDEHLLEMIRSDPGSAIVYCATRRTVEEIAAMIARAIPQRAVVGYHAGMDQPTRIANQERFMQTPSAIAVATNAFGMGINKPNIRLVIHYNMPGTLEAYYQEAGRAGRDGQPARCVLLFSIQDRFIHEYFISKIGENGDMDARRILELQAHARMKLERVVRYAQSHDCRRQVILDYFGDETTVSDCRCDACGGDGSVAATDSLAVMSDDVITLTRQLLSGIARLRGRFGIGAIAEVLVGISTDRSQRWGLEQLSVFGLLKHYSAKQVIAMLHRLIEAGLARQRSAKDAPEMRLLDLTTAGVAVMKGEHPPPMSLTDLIPQRKRRSRLSARSTGESVNASVNEPVLEGSALDRFERLRAARLQLARDRQLPAFAICHDTTLKLIASTAPNDIAALGRIRGMGPLKLRMYGEALLTALKGN